jgi:hypothetical protein
MDLFLSAQSLGLTAFVAAGCMVAAGALSSGIARRRARRQRDAVPPSDPYGLERGRQVAVVGRLHVDGSCCARLEDAAPVAASSFLHDCAGKTSAACVRAATLWLEVGGSRVELIGPVLVDVGSDEQYPASLVDLHGGGVAPFIAAQLLPRRNGTPRHGVFRSLRPGDEVVVIGLVERQGSASWRLVPAPPGVLIACYRRRPRIRGAFGGLQLWAAALLART